MRLNEEKFFTMNLISNNQTYFNTSHNIQHLGVFRRI